MARGRWNIGGINLPDFGLSERVTNWQANPLIRTVEASSGGGGVLGDQILQDDLNQYSSMDEFKASWNPAPGNRWDDPSPPAGGGGGGGGGGGSTNNPYDKNRDPDSWARHQGYSGFQDYLDQGAGGGGEDYSQQINELYEPTLKLLGEVEGQARQAETKDIEQLGKRVEDARGDYLEQKEDLLTTTSTEENKFRKVIDSALSQAVRAYNALNQQRTARFGGASSAGQAVGELAQQEFFRQQGQIGQKSAEGQAAFGQEKIRIGKYVTDRLDKLKLYRDEAETEIKRNLRDTLNDITAQRTATEANKTRDKMTALQVARDRVSAIKIANQDFQKNLGLAAIQRLQDISGTAFTPNEIRATMAEFGISLPNIGTSSAAQSASQLRTRPRTDDDPYEGLLSGTGKN